VGTFERSDRGNEADGEDVKQQMSVDTVLSQSELGTNVELGDGGDGRRDDREEFEFMDGVELGLESRVNEVGCVALILVTAIR